MPTTIDGSTGISQVQDGVIAEAKLASNAVSTTKVQNGAVTPAKTQLGATPSMVRLNTANGYGSTNTAIRRFTTTVTNQGTDITYADSATLGASFTINTNGVYSISYNDSASLSNPTFGISLNSAQLTTSVASITIANRLAVTGTTPANFPAFAAWTGYLVAGDVIRAHGDLQAAGSSVASFTISRVA